MAFRVLIIGIIQFFVAGAIGQTCCSAGAPVSTFLGIADANDQSLSFQLNYEYNSINLLIDDNEKLENDPRSRYGQSISMKVDYTLNQKWAFSTILPLVHHSRNTISDNQNSFGIGELCQNKCCTVDQKVISAQK